MGRVWALKWWSFLEINFKWSVTWEMVVTENTEKCPNDEFDVPWKDVLGAYFPEFLAFFLPVAYV